MIRRIVFRPAMAGAIALAACSQQGEPAGRSTEGLGPSSDALVTVGSPPDLFPRNDQDDAAIAFYARRPRE
jgi:hypothetical protein